MEVKWQNYVYVVVPHAFQQDKWILTIFWKFFIVSIRKLVVPVCAEKSYLILDILIQTSINFSDNSITIVLQW